nr:hypothetical protein HK105_007903 [Polyrhizophydium stewartii]
MLTVYSEKQLLHHPPKEMVIGRFIDYRETPSRAETIIKAIRDRNVGDVVAPVDRGLAPILAVHTEKYVSYFQTAYEKWIEIGGNPDGVFPDTFAVRLSQIYQDISDGGAGGRPGFFSYDMTAIIAKGAAALCLCPVHCIARWC